MIRQLQIDQTVAGQRLDLFLASHLRFDQASETNLSRAEIQKLISRGQVTLNGRRRSRARALNCTIESMFKRCRSGKRR